MAKQKNATRKLLITVGIIAVVLVGVIVIGKSTGLFGSKEVTIKVETAEAEIRRVTQTVTASGKAQPEIEVIISPDVSGEIIALPVKEGDQVSRGQLLARIKPDFYQAQVEQSEASVLQAKASESARRADLLTAESALNRQRELHKTGAISDADLEAAVNRYETAKANHEAAQFNVQITEARLREMKENLSKTSIHAPMDGTISTLLVEFGERVVGTTQMTGTEMMRVARLDQMELDVDVNENDVVNVALGDTASIEIDAYPNRSFKGVVTEIANSARTMGAGTQEQITNFPVKIRILAAHNTAFDQSARDGAIADDETNVNAETPNFRPGMSGTVDIFTHTVDGAIAVPIQAVTVRDFAAIAREKARGASADSTANAENDASGDQMPGRAGMQEEDIRRVVFVMDGTRARMVEVETGIADDTHIVIISGLSSGDKVITGPYSAVSRTLGPDDLVEESSPNTRRGPNMAAN
ncbi:MAG: efflux RND transporter periplasmic adaptor subunit [Rhodothermales bacterium]